MSKIYATGLYIRGGYLQNIHERIQRGGGTGGPDPPEKSQIYRVSSNTGPDP